MSMAVIVVAGLLALFVCYRELWCEPAWPHKNLARVLGEHQAAENRLQVRRVAELERDVFRCSVAELRAEAERKAEADWAQRALAAAPKVTGDPAGRMAQIRAELDTIGDGDPAAIDALIAEHEGLSADWRITEERAEVVRRVTNRAEFRRPRYTGLRCPHSACRPGWSRGHASILSRSGVATCA